MRIRGAKVFDIDRFTERDLCIEEGRIAETCCDDRVIDAAGCIAIPGLVDIHFHGAMGSDLCDAGIEALERIATYEASRGITFICPATMTYPGERLLSIMETVKRFDEVHGEDPAYAKLVGINLEGPFISSERIGAQNPDFVIPADSGLLDRLQEACGNRIRLVDLAPECFDNMDFIRENANRVHISLAHTNCDYDTALRAFTLGADHLTHLFNAMPGMHHRLPGPIAAGAEQRAFAEIIADGIHVHPAMVRLAFRIFGADRMVLISDSMRACGLADGVYELGGQAVIVSGRKAVLKEEPATIAGSCTDLFDCMRSAVKEMGIPLADAVRAATYNPACSIGAEDSCGSFLPGRRATVLLLNKELELVRIIR